MFQHDSHRGDHTSIICGAGNSPHDLLDLRSLDFVVVQTLLNELPRGFRDLDRLRILRFNRAKARRDPECEFGDFDPTKWLLSCQDPTGC